MKRSSNPHAGMMVSDSINLCLLLLSLNQNSCLFLLCFTCTIFISFTCTTTVILTPSSRPSNEPLTHAMSFTLRGLQSGSVYEAIVQAKNRYGWNEVSCAAANVDGWLASENLHFKRFFFPSLALRLAIFFNSTHSEAPRIRVWRKWNSLPAQRHVINPTS